MRPIKFNNDMVRAILAGHKTQTRRALTPQPPEGCGKLLGPEIYEPGVVDKAGDFQPGPSVYGVYDEWGEYGLKCPFGQPGDRLWVKEEFAMKKGVVYRADQPDDWGWDGKPPSSLKKWMSRILLEITTVRVERLQDITEEGAKAEGAAWSKFNGGGYVISFFNLWKSIYGDDAWNENPWVWVIEFKRIK